MTTTTEPRTNAHAADCRRCRGLVEVGAGRLLDRTCGGRYALDRVGGYRWEVEHLDRELCDAVYAASPAGLAEARKARVAAARAAEETAQVASGAERRREAAPFDPYAARGGWDRTDFPHDVSSEHHAARFLVAAWRREVGRGRAANA